jgi:hypothetical protein
MSWLNRFRKNESASVQLSKKVFQKSLSGAQALKPDLENKFGKDTKEFQSKYFPVLFEFMYFFLHVTDRLAFNQLGPERRNQLIDSLVPPTIDATIETYFDHWPQKSKDSIRKDFYSNLNTSQTEYGSCKELLLRPEDDTTTLERMSGVKSKSAVGRLTDNLSQIIEGTINLDALFTIRIWDVAIDGEMELCALVSEVQEK